MGAAVVGAAASVLGEESSSPPQAAAIRLSAIIAAISRFIGFPSVFVFPHLGWVLLWVTSDWFPFGWSTPYGI